jgi:hypothetical protein
MAAGGIYAKLEQGSRTNGRSRAWYGRIKNVRKNDELLSYLHHARNSEEHGLDGSLLEDGSKLEPVSEEDIAQRPPQRGRDAFYRLKLPSGKVAYVDGREVAGFRVTPSRR